MKNKVNSRFVKWISVALTIVIVLASIPVSGNVAFAEEGSGIVIQYLSNRIVQSGVELKIKPDENADTTYTGITNEKGVWQTEVAWADLTETFYVYINGDAKTVTKSEEEKNYLIINADEKTWSTGVLAVEKVEVSASKTSVTRSETFTLTSTVSGTPETYQWYYNSQKIEGATSAVYIKENASVSDSGAYSCKVTDINGDSRISDMVTITVSEKKLTGVSLKAYANGAEINGFVSRDTVDEVELRLVGLPSDASVTQVKYYVNGNCLSSETSNLSYTFSIEDGVEEYDCEAEIAFDKYYEQTRLELSAPIQATMLSQSPIEIKVDGAEYNITSGAYILTYSSSPKTIFEVTVSGGSGSGDYSLKVIEEKTSSGSTVTNDGKIAEISRYAGENKWKVKINNAGSFKLRASKAGDGNYNSVASVSVNFNVAKATADGFAFETPAPEAIVYNTNNNEYTNAVADVFSGVKYSIESGDCAEVDENTGRLTVKKAGTVTVKATLAESENYLEATATYTLTIKKANQTIRFEDKNDTVYYGQSYSRVAIPVKDDDAADGYGYNQDENVKIQYSIVANDGEEAVADVKEDGSLEFANQKLGTVTVKATLAGNDCYESTEAEYSLAVEAYMVENGYTISGDKLVTDSEWYSGDIIIEPSENHLISKINNLGETNEWADSIVITTEGAANGCDVYIKNIETGAISQAYSISSESLMLDKSVPHSLKVNYKTESWYQEVLETVTFGYYNSVVTFTLEAEDDCSGIEYFVWKFTSHDNGDVEVPETRVEATQNGDIYESDVCVLGNESNLQEFRGKISFFAYDFAGNSAESKETYVVVIDAQDPVLDITTDLVPESTVNNRYPFENADENTAEPIEIFGGEVKVTLCIVEKNFFVENAVVSINGEDISNSLSWNLSGDNHYAELFFDDDGDYKIVLTYNDVFGDDINNADIKKSYVLSKQICVDTQNPVVSLILSGADFENEAVKYYNSSVVAEVTVKEEKFRPSDITVSGVEGFYGMNAEHKEHLSNASNWTYDAETGIYSAFVEFDSENADGEYAFTVDYSDLSDKTADQANSGNFVIDTVNPELIIAADKLPERTVKASYPYEPSEKDADSTVDIYGEDVNVTFAVTEKNFFPERIVVTVNGEDVSADVEWISSGDTHTAKLIFDETDDFSLSLSYTDIFGDNGNAEEKAVYNIAELIAVDKTAPEIVVVLSEANTENEGVKYYNSNVRAAITVKDEKFRPSDLVVSGIDGYIEISNENKEYLLNSENWKYNEKDGSYNTSIVFASENADGSYKFALDYADLAGNTAQQVVADDFVIDVNSPVISVDYGDAKILDSDNLVIDSLENRDYNSITVFNNSDIVVTVAIEEANFDSEKATVMLSKDFGEAKAYDFDGEWISNGNVHTNTVTLSEKDVYKLVFSCTDRSLNDSNDYCSPKIVISDTVPSITFDVQPESETGYRNSDTVDVTVKIFDEFFAEENVDITVKAEDIDGKKIEFQENDIIPDYKNVDWVAGENFCNSITLTLSTEGRYTVVVEYTNQMDDKSKSACDFVLDRTAPTHTVRYSEPVYKTVWNTITFMLFNTDINVTVESVDNISGVDRMEITYPNELVPENYYGTKTFETKVTYVQDSEKDEKIFEKTWTVNAENASVQAKANVSVVVTDNANNSTEEGDRIDTNNTIAVDNVASTISLSYGDAKILNSDNVVISSFNETEKGNVTIYDKKDITVTVKVKEVNFNSETVTCKLSKNNGETAEYKFDGEWTADGIIHTNTVTISGEGIYKLTVNCKDFAGNESSYISAKMVISESIPNITFNIMTQKDGEYKNDYYNTTIDFDVKIFDEYFSSERVEITVTARDAYGKEFSPKYKISDWKKGENTSNVVTLTFAAEGIYNVFVKYTNAVGDNTDSSRTFVIDLTAPLVSSDIKDSDDEVNFGATIFIEEENFDPLLFDISIAGRDIGGNTITKDVKNYFQNKENWTTEKGTFKHKITISDFEDGLYVITVTGNDKALNDAEKFRTSEFTVDSTAPYNIKIEYLEPVSTGKSSSGKEDTNVLYYKNSVKVILTAEDSTSGVTQFDWVYNRTADAGSANKDTLKGTIYLDASSRTATAEFLLPEGTSSDQLRGNLTVTATDRLGNTSEPYTDKSNTVVVDNTAPKIEFEYSPSEPKKSDGDFSEGGANYYDTAVTVTVIVEETNFDPDYDIKNTNGNEYKGMVLMLNEEPYKVSSWAKAGNKWRADIELTNDGSYILSAAYSDPSGNAAESLKTGEIVVDRNAPVISVTYLPDKPIYSSGERKFYSEDQIATITITERNFDPADVVASVTTKNIGESAETQTDLAASLIDDSSWKKDGDVYTATIKYSIDGNYTFNIEYTDPSGNKAEEYAVDELTVDKSAPENLEIKFSGSPITNESATLYYDVPIKVTVTATDKTSGVKSFEYSYTSSVTGETVRGTQEAVANGANARAEFYIPGNEVAQFKGSVKAAAIDNSGNKTAVAERKETVIYDNKAPVGNIELGTTVTNANGMSYYSNVVEATINIDESNFDGNDVIVLVDGNDVNTGSWSNNGDTWTTTVNVSADGQHQISVSYTDKSGNQMESIETESFVIDHTAPSIIVNGIKNKAAYNDDQISFTITAEDDNFSSSGLNADLTAIVQNKDGKFETKTIELEQAYSSSRGYTIDVKNLEEDGIYTLTCKASDLCGNDTNVILIDGSKENAVTFSVNRNGSTFDVDDATKKLVEESRYTQNLDGNIIITEINVSPIVEHTVKVNGVELENGKHYEVKAVEAEGEWYKYVYTIYADNFANENDYSVVISSKDGNENTGYSDLKGRPIEFTIDKTAPTVSVSGIESNGSYKTDKLTVNIIPSDAGGMIQKFEVVADGKSIASYTGEKIANIVASSDGIVSIDIGEGTYDNIRFICTDEAGNVYDSGEAYKDIAISPNQFVLLWSKDWFKFIIIGGPVFVAGLILFVIFKKKKEEE